MTSGIYAIRRLDSDRMYVGSAVNLSSRWAVHKCRLRKGTHHSPQLQSAWTKHGALAFEFVVLELVPDKSGLIAAEQAWIDKLNPFYNTVKIAGSVAGHTLSAEARKKISIASSSRRYGPPSAETRAKISAANSGRKLSLEHREKLSAAKLGRKRGSYSAEHRAGISAGVARAHERRRMEAAL